MRVVLLNSVSQRGFLLIRNWNKLDGLRVVALSLSCWHAKIPRSPPSRRRSATTATFSLFMTVTVAKALSIDSSSRSASEFGHNVLSDVDDLCCILASMVVIVRNARIPSFTSAGLSVGDFLYRLWNGFLIELAAKILLIAAWHWHNDDGHDDGTST